MRPRFSKVVALSRRPAAVAEPTPAQSDPQQSSRDTVPSEATVSSQGTVSLKRYRCFSAQDGHSFAEERLYNALWHARHAQIESEDSRLVTAGWDLMSKLAGMTPRNAKENCHRLLQKLALEKVQAHRSEERIGATYRVYSYAIILQRRRTAGLEWITRNRGGVTFVSSPVNDSRDTVSPKPQTRDTVPSQDTGTVPSQDTVLLERQSAVSPKKQATSDEKQTQDTVPSQGTPLDKEQVKESQSSSSGFSTIHEVARKWSVVLDDDAVRKLIRRCRVEDPAATEDEIATFLDVKCRQLRDSPTRNMVGMLLSAVPAYFAKPATELAKYRQQKSEERAKHLQIAREILEDPESAPQSREWAQNFIASREGK